MKTSLAFLLLATAANAGIIHYDGVQDDSPAEVRRPPFFNREFAQPRQVIDVTVFGDEQVRIDTWDIFSDTGEHLIWSIAPGTYDLVHVLHGVRF